MYWGSVRFIRHLIITVFLLMCVTPLASAIIFSVKLQSVQKQLDNVATVQADSSASLLQISNDEAQLKQQIGSLTQQIATRKQLNDSLNEQTAVLQQQFNGTLSQEITSLQKLLNTVNARIVLLRQQLDGSLNEQTVVLQQQSDSMQNEIIALQEQLSDINDKLDTYQQLDDSAAK